VPTSVSQPNGTTAQPFYLGAPYTAPTPPQPGYVEGPPSAFPAAGGFDAWRAIPQQSSGQQAQAGSTGLAAKASKTTGRTRRNIGAAIDAGIPDGANLGLVVRPFDWARLGASVGTNTAAFNYRGGLSLLPTGWGPSFDFEVGHCNIADLNSLLRKSFSVPNWVKPYVQQLGYTYFNAHVGFDLPLGDFIIFAHGGYTYLAATVRAPNPVVVDKNTGTTVTIAHDGNVQAHTVSGKVGLIFMFGGI